jgi:hypothetical protein
MPIPEKIPILRMEDYHTHYLGKTDDGRQFFGYETFVFPPGVPAEALMKHRKEYVVLYLFDDKGNHSETKHWFAGTVGVADQEKMIAWLQDEIEKLGNVTYTDIEVKPFQSTVDGVVFGLVSNEEHKAVELQPNSTIAFYEPWDGEYYT